MFTPAFIRRWACLAFVAQRVVLCRDYERRRQTLQLVEETESPLDLVFSDIFIPGPIDGRAMESKIGTLYSNLPVILYWPRLVHLR